MAAEKKYIAKHLIPITKTPGNAGDKAKGIAPVKPVVKEIKPGDRVMLDPEAEDTKFLLDNGAIEMASADDEKAAVKDAPAKKAPAKKPTTGAKKPAAKKDDGEDTTGGDNKDLV